MRWVVLIVVLLAAAFASFSLGPNGFSLSNAVVLRDIRLPHVLLGIVAGGVLALVGASLQGLLGNPLVDPYTLGVANGAALGTTIGVALGHFGSLFVPLLAIAGATTTLLLVYAIARLDGRVTKIGLVLSGVIVSFLLSGLVMLIMVLARKPLDQIIYLLMGNLDVVLTPPKVILFIVCGVLAAIGLVWLYSYSRELNILATNEEVAESLGVNTQRTTKVIFVVSSLLVGLVVAFVGAISFIGLIVPHIARLVFGPDHGRTMPGSFLMGASLLLIADMLARLTTPVLPLSVVTAFIGVPFFVYLFRAKLGQS